LSGDEAACREAEEFVPGITTVSVKEGLSLHSAISVSPKVARERIAAGVSRALARHRDKPVDPLRWPGPYVLDKVFRNAADAEADAKEPRAVERVEGRTLRFRSGDIAEIIYS
jgi:D-amino peptidase